ARAWDQLPTVDAPPGIALSATARDLDLFGPASLYRLCCLAGTVLGRTLLARWLLSPAAPSEALARQRGIAELAEQLDLRQELAWRGQMRSDANPAADPTSLVSWAEGDVWLAHRPLLTWYSRLSPPLLIALAVSDYFALTTGPWWQMILFGQIAVSLALVRGVHGIFRQIDAGEQQLQRYREMLALVETWPVTAPILAHLQQQLTVDGHRAHAQLSRLRRLLDLADLRFAQLVYGVIQAFTLWDFHVLAALERWQRRFGRHIRGWLDVLAEFEALASLATLAFDHPRWTYPKLDPQGPRTVSAVDLAHPLLSDPQRVGNDVELGPPGNFLLVTGSNMSGKSTLLRAVGLNLILAQAGAPVCASRLTLPRVAVETSMRIDDSLAAGVSLFLAELQRLKAIVDRARECGAADQPVLVFLLDEILHGTNSRDRQVAVRRVVQHLLDMGAIGAVSTHDLELAAAGPLAMACHAVHFREAFSGAGDQRQMTFDYHLRTGIASSANALELLDLVGLTDHREVAKGDKAV
ncbi:MAG TPA: hypothetical protein VGH84_12790, partial [Steroidobacteraceae bacterium]